MNRVIKKDKISKTIDQLKKVDLDVNNSKWFYLTSKEDIDLNKLGIFKYSLKYLDCQLSYSKSIMMKKLKEAWLKNVQKVRKFCLNWTGVIPKQLIQGWSKSITLYHLTPSLITNEINIKDASKLIKSIEDKLRPIPACCNYELLTLMNPGESTICWIRRWWLKHILNLRENPKIHHGMAWWIWKVIENKKIYELNAIETRVTY